MEKIRINKFLAELGVGSRRAIDKMIEEKRIKVNGILAESGIKVDKSDKIFVNGKLLEFEKKKKVYFMLNKPKRVLSTAKDERGRKTVVDLIDTKERIFHLVFPLFHNNLEARPHCLFLNILKIYQLLHKDLVFQCCLFFRRLL